MMSNLSAPSGQAPPHGSEQTDWPTDSSMYTLLGKIGQGAFASVWKAQPHSRRPAATAASNDPTLYCAVKVLNLDNVDTNLTEIRREVQLMRLSSHENILCCHTAFVDETNLWLVTTLMDKGSSLHCLNTARRRKRQKLEPHIMHILHETLLGLQYFHENGQIHRDIKGGNILLNARGDVRIADFGVSGWLVLPHHEKAQTFVGTPCWMAPEVMEQIHGYNHKADLWSLGITALELAKGYAPYAKYPPVKVVITTIQEDPPSLDTYDYEESGDETEEQDDYHEDWSKSFRNVIRWLLEKNPNKRPTCAELLSSHYFASHNREAHRTAMQTNVCSLVEDVGSSSSSSSSSSLPLAAEAGAMIAASADNDNNTPRFQGHTPIQAVQRPAGTTWVFADGSQVITSTQTQPTTVDEVIDELDQISKLTGGENYRKPNESAAATTPAPAPPAAKEDDDGLDDFYEEFEKSTGGEHFRR